MNIKKILITSTIVFSLSLSANDANNTKESATLLNTVSKSTQDLIITAKEKIESITVEDIKKGATSTWEKTKEVSSTTWDKTKDSVNELAESNTSKSIISGSDKYLSKFKNYITSDTNSTTLKKVKEIGKDIKTYSEEKYNELTK